MNGSTAIILDLAARGRATARQWRHWEAECLEALAPAQALAVHGAEQAEAAAREAALEGAEKLIAAGGNAAAHGVLNALMGLAESHRARLKFGLLSLDRAEEWARTLGLPRGLGRQLEVLRAGNTLPMDVGRAECLDLAGRPLMRHFLNGACFGIPTQIRNAWRQTTHAAARAAQPARPRPSGTAPGADAGLLTLDALARTLRLLAGRDDASVRLVQEGPDGAAGTEGAVEIYGGPWVAGLLMVGRYYPGFGEVAPQADPSDGALDLVGLTGRPGWLALGWLSGLLPRALPAPGWTAERGQAFSATELGGPVFLELDGIAVGRLPARLSIVVRQLPTIVPTVPARLMKPLFKPIPAVAERPLVAGHVKTKLPLGA